MSDKCEWNPVLDEPAMVRNGEHVGCQNDATISVGYEDNWHLCESCAALPRFRRKTRRIALADCIRMRSVF